MQTKIYGMKITQNLNDIAYQDTVTLGLSVIECHRNVLHMEKIVHLL